MVRKEKGFTFTFTGGSVEESESFGVRWACEKSLDAQP